MARPKCSRNISCEPDYNYYKPRGVPSSALEEVVLSLDEFEAIKLADYSGLYQEEASQKMNISRQTFGRIIESAHKKIADALINGKAIKIEGGVVNIEMNSNCGCKKYNKDNENKSETAKLLKCPKCNKSL